MAFPNDLLEQAHHLVTREARGAPRQASLRRAISAAYYALFHLLTEQAASALAPPSPDLLRSRIQRAFDHSRMKTACRSASGGQLPLSLRPLLHPAVAYSAAIQLVASSFLQLQQARHEADYDTTKRYSRADAQQLVELADQAFTAWQTAKGGADANVFLAALLLQDRWDR